MAIQLFNIQLYNKLTLYFSQFVTSDIYFGIYIIVLSNRAILLTSYLPAVLSKGEFLESYIK